MLGRSCDPEAPSMKTGRLCRVRRHAAVLMMGRFLEGTLARNPEEDSWWQEAKEVAAAIHQVEVEGEDGEEMEARGLGGGERDRPSHNLRGSHLAPPAGPGCRARVGVRMRLVEGLRRHSEGEDEDERGIMPWR